MISVRHKDIYLGQLVKPVGVKGELKLAPSPDFWEGVLESEALMLRFSEKSKWWSVNSCQCKGGSRTAPTAGDYSLNLLLDKGQREIERKIFAC